MRPLLVLVLATACQPPQEEPRSIAEARQLTILTGPGSVRVRPDWSRNVTDPCPVVRDDLTGQLAGMPITIEEPGHWTSEFDGAQECAPPELVVSASSTPVPASLELSDGGGTIVCDLADALQPRTATPVPAGPWELAAGQPVTLRWSHAELDMLSINIELLIGELRYDVESVSTTNELVMFTVPASVPPGIYRLQLLASGMEDGEPCAGISTYRHTGHPITQQVTITPAT